MCLLPENEQFAAVDETADWGVTHLRQPRRDNVIPMPTKPVHELQAHVEADPEASLLRDFLVMWSGIDWFWTITGIFAFLGGVLTIVAGMLALATLLGHTDVLPHVLAVIGVAL